MPIAGCDLRDEALGKPAIGRKLAERMELPAVLRELGQGELRAVCRRHGLDASPKARVVLQGAILEAAGLDPHASRAPEVLTAPDALPARGQVVDARRRQWMVDDVSVGVAGDSPLVRLVCLDDDDPGRALDVLWDLELGARVVAPETHGLGDRPEPDPPARLGAYLHAAWVGEASGIKPYKDRATAVDAITGAERLLASGAKVPNATIRARIGDHASALFRALWPHLEAEADAIGAEARQGLLQRARRESGELREILGRQRTAIDKAENRLRQEDLFGIQDKDQKRQIELDLKHLDKRTLDAAKEIETEPRAIEALYDVRMQRLTPIGMVVAWPEAMT